MSSINFEKIFRESGIDGLRPFCANESFPKQRLRVTKVKEFCEGEERRVLVDERGRLFLVEVPIKDQAGGKVGAITFPGLIIYLGVGGEVLTVTMIRE